MLYAVIAANEAAVATKMALARDDFETRPMAESLSTRPLASIDFHDRSAAPKVGARMQGEALLGRNVPTLWREAAS